MPDLLTEEQAASTLNELETTQLSQEERDQRVRQLDAYKVDRQISNSPLFPAAEYKQASDRIDRDFQTFSGVDELKNSFDEEKRKRFDDALKFSPNPDEELQRFANVAYIKDNSEVDPETLAKHWDLYRPQFAKQLFDHDGEISDSEFYAKMGERTKEKFQSKELIKGIQKAGVNAATGALVQGKDLDLNKAWAEFEKEIQSADGYSEEAHDDYLRLFRSGYQFTTETQQATAVAARELMPLFEAWGEDINADTLPNADKIIDRLIDMEPGQADLALSFVARMAAQDDRGHNFIEGIKRSYERGIAGPALGSARMLREKAAQDILDTEEPLMIPGFAEGDTDEEFYRKVVGEGIVQSVTYATIGAPRQRQATPEETAILKEQAQKSIARSEMISKAFGILTGEVEPVIPDGLMERSAFGASGMAPMLALGIGGSMLGGPSVGGSIIGAGLATSPVVISSRYEEYRNKGLAIGDAQSLAMISGAIESGIEGLQAVTIVGKAPWAKKLTNKLMGNSFARQLAARATVNIAAENIQEGLQDLTPLVVQEAASVLSEDIPGVEWDTELQQWKDSRADVFLAMLPLSVFGAAGATMSRQQQIDYAKQLADPQVSQLMGLDQTEAGAIAAEPNLEQRGEMFQTAMQQVEPAQVAQNRQQALTELQQTVDAVQEAGVQIDQTNNGYLVRFPDGNAVQTRSRGAAMEVAQEYTQETQSFDANSDEVFNAVIPSTPRVTPAPITGTGTKMTREILFDASRELGVNVKYKGAGRGALGSYYPGSARTAVKYEGDLDTAAHEIAHNLDDRFGIVAQWAGARQKSPFDAELRPFAEHGSITAAGDRAKLNYVRAEGVAEWVRAWLVNPDAAVKAAPFFHAHFESVVPEKGRKALRRFGDEIRRFAGAKPSEQIGANVLGLDRESKTKKLIKEIFGKNKKAGFNITIWDRMGRQWLDSMRPLEAAVNFARKEAGVKSLIPENDPMVLARLISGINGKAETIYQKGMINTRSERVTEGGASWLFGTLDSSSDKSLNQDTRDVASLMIAERTIEKIKQAKEKEARGEGKAKKYQSGIGGGVVPEMEVAQGTIAELKQDPARYERLAEAAKRYRQWADANLRYLVDSGRLSEQGYRSIIEANQHYVAMKRVYELAPGEELEMSNSKVLGRMKGSAKVIENPYIELMESTQKIIAEGDRNLMMLSFTDLLTTGRAMYDGDQNQMESVGSQTTSDDLQKIPVYRNGKREYWRFDNDVHKALTGYIETSKHNVFMVPAQLLRWGVTRMPAFAIRNIIRDTQSRLTVTRSGTKQSLLETFDLRGKFDPEQLKLYGGDHSGFYMRDKVDWARALRGTMQQLAEDKGTMLVDPRRLADFAAKGWRGYESLLEKGEQFNRIAEYKAAYKHAQEKLGYDEYNSHLHAAAEARDLIDFAVAGETARQLNQYIPFFNPALQGSKRLWRAAKEDPKVFVARFITFAVIPSVLVRQLAEEGGYGDEYEQLPAYLRDLYWNFKIADDQWIRIPKNFEVGVLSSGFERLYSKEVLGEENAFDGYGGSLARTILPVDEAAMGGPFKTAVSVLANYDFFKQSYIVPPHQAKVNLDHTNKKGERTRKSERASRIGIGMQALFEKIGWEENRLGDARIVDFVIKDTFGIAGDTVLRASNTGRDDTRQKVGMKDLGVFVGTPAYAAKDVQWSLNYAERNGIATNSKTFDQLNAAFDRYWEAEDAKGRDQAGKQVQQAGTALRKLLEASEDSE